MTTENNLNIPGNANADGTANEEHRVFNSSSGYDIDSLVYPEDLGRSDSIHGGNRVMFFINVTGGSKIAVEDKDNTSTMGLPKSRYRDASGETVDKLKENLRAEKRISVAGKSFEMKESELRVLSPKKRLKSVISLYIPEALVKSYGVSWEEASADEMIGGELLAQGAVALTSALPGSNTKFGDEGMRTLNKATSAGFGYLLNNIKYAQKATGVTPGNSKAQLLFNRVDFNTFTFDYRFSPKSSSEARKVLSIIRTFRHHMLPEFFDAEQFLYIYPSEFEIRYFRGVAENEFLEHHITSVLTNMTINYNPNGQYTTFSDGMPTHINLSLTFKELGVPTKETSPSDKSGA